MNRRGPRAASVLMALAMAATIPATGRSEAATGAPDSVVVVTSSGTAVVLRPGQANYTLPISGHTWYLGDWDGDGFDTPAWEYFAGSSNNFAWTNTLRPDGTIGAPGGTIQGSGPSGSGEVVIGDWDGDGRDGFAIDVPGTSPLVCPNTWSCTNWPSTGRISIGGDLGEPSVPSSPQNYWFGIGYQGPLFGPRADPRPGDMTLGGDMDGDGIDTMVAYRVPESKFYYSNTNPPGSGAVAPTDGELWFGVPGDIPLIGDWDGDGIDTPGVYRPSNGTVYLRNSLSTGVADVTFIGGFSGEVLVGHLDLP